MENASKALIIAGAILISILLISIGLIVFNSGSGIADEASTASKSMAVTTSNSRFTQYFGPSVSGLQTQALIRTVMTNNSMAESRIIKINLMHGNTYISIDTGDDAGHEYTTAQLQYILDKVSPASKYDIHVTSDCTEYNRGLAYDSDGYIRCITIIKN